MSTPIDTKEHTISTPTYTRLRAVRVARGLSQRDVAAFCRVHYSTVSYWESGRMKPRRSAARRLARLLDTPVDVLMTMNDNDPTHASGR